MPGACIKPVTSAPVLRQWLRATGNAIPLVAGLGAAVAIGVVGCTTSTDGAASVDKNDVPAYRTSVSVSRSAASVTSSVREAERQATLTTEAVHTVCETLSTSSADAVKTVNAYVDAANTGGDLVATAAPAKDALNGSADQVAADISDTLPQPLRDALNSWVDASRAAAGVLAVSGPAADFNAAVDRVNNTRSQALDLCDASY